MGEREMSSIWDSMNWRYMRGSFSRISCLLRWLMSRKTPPFGPARPSMISL